MADARIWPSTNGPDTKNVEAVNVTLGLKATCVATGVVLKKIHYYRPTDLTTGARSVAIFTAGNATPIYTSAFTDVGFGWQDHVLPTPLALTNGTSYLFCWYFNSASGGYASSNNYYTSGAGSAGFNLGGMVTVPNDATAGGGQNQYKQALGASLPDSTYQGTNYWIDITVGTLNTEVTKSLSTQWNVSAPVTKSLSTQWNVRAVASDSLSTQWNVRSALGKNQALSWAVGQALTLNRSVGWNTRQLVGLSRDVSWSVYGSVALNRSTQWNILGVLTKSASLVWEVGQRVGVSLDTRWNVSDSSTVLKSLPVAWGVRASTILSLDIDWEIREAVLIDRDIAWEVSRIVADTVTSQWNVRASIFDALNTRWNVASNSATHQTVLRLYVNGAWVTVPVKAWNGSDWVEVPVRSYDNSSGTWI